MTRKTLRNVDASVRARLSQRARKRKENIQLALMRYAIERLLCRLRVSEYRDQFVLKGAMAFQRAATPYRSTDDLDLLGFGDVNPERVAGDVIEQRQKPLRHDGWKVLKNSSQSARCCVTPP